jgi:hypothetical protein
MMDFEGNRIKLIMNTLDCLCIALDYYQGQDKKQFTDILVNARTVGQALTEEANNQEKSIYPDLDRMYSLTIEFRKEIFKVTTFVRDHIIAFSDMLHTAKIPIEYLFAGLDANIDNRMTIH